MAKTETKEKKVAIVGFAGSSRELVNAVDPDVEIWGLNNAYTFMKTKATRWFEVHGHEGRDEYRAKHWEKLEELDIPILALHPPANVKNVEELRFADICQEIGVEPYLTNSIAYMLMYAIYAKATDIRLYGVDMATGTEYEKQRPCTEYWIGIARGAGIRVTIPDVSPICQGLLYGVDRDDGFTRKMILDDMAQIRQNRETDLANYQRMLGANAQMQKVMEAFTHWEQDKDKPIDHDGIEEIMMVIQKETSEQEMNLLRQYHTVDGALQGLTWLAKKIFLKDMSHPELDALGEFSDIPSNEKMLDDATLQMLNQEAAINGVNPEAVPVGND